MSPRQQFDESQAEKTALSVLAEAVSISKPQMQLLLQNLHNGISLELKFTFNSTTFIK